MRQRLQPGLHASIRSYLFNSNATSCSWPSRLSTKALFLYSSPFSIEEKLKDLWLPLHPLCVKVLGKVKRIWGRVALIKFGFQSFGCPTTSSRIAQVRTPTHSQQAKFTLVTQASDALHHIWSALWRSGCQAPWTMQSWRHDNLWIALCSTYVVQVWLGQQDLQN